MNPRTVLLAALTAFAFVTIPTSSHAARHGQIIDCDMRGCSDHPIVSRTVTGKRKSVSRHRHVVKARKSHGRKAVFAGTRKGDGCRSGTGALSCVTPVLAAKARQIVNDCGSQVVSAIAGRPNRSNHPIGRAVDLVGNPSCIYSHLKGWPGGYSTDYGRVHHVHVSYNPGGQEWGVRFAHRGGGSRTRYARHMAVPQYATALPRE